MSRSKPFLLISRPMGENERRSLELRWLKLVAVNPVIDPMHTAQRFRESVSRELIRSKIADSDDGAGR